MNRPEVDEYFLKMAQVISDRATCKRHNIGALAVKDKHILATGYNGAPSGLKDCLELGCIRDERGIASGERAELCRAVHAEQNVIVQAATHGVSLVGSTIYSTNSPCRICAKMLVNAGIERFVCSNRYSDDSFKDLFEQAGIKFEYKA